MASKKRLAVTEDFKLTYCTASPENIGKGRCNHINHQLEGEDPKDFVNRNEELKKEEKKKIIDLENVLLLSQEGEEIVSPHEKMFILADPNEMLQDRFVETWRSQFGSSHGTIPMKSQYGTLQFTVIPAPSRTTIDSGDILNPFNFSTRTSTLALLPLELVDKRRIKIADVIFGARSMQVGFDDGKVTISDDLGRNMNLHEGWTVKNT